VDFIVNTAWVWLAVAIVSGVASFADMAQQTRTPGFFTYSSKVRMHLGTIVFLIFAFATMMFMFSLLVRIFVDLHTHNPF